MRAADLSRRGLLGAIICAPAIVRASSLMAVKALPDDNPLTGYADLSEEALEHALMRIRELPDNRWFLTTNPTADSRVYNRFMAADTEDFSTAPLEYSVFLPMHFRPNA